MKITEDLIEGIFLEECKSRFICTVLIENKICECYVPSASKLKNYLNMIGKRVLLMKNSKINSRTRYSLFAVKYYDKYILLDLLLVNRILEEYLKWKYIKNDVKREKYFEGYKSDFLVLGERNIIIEAKGMIAARKSIDFPTVFSQRSIDQLRNILKFLKSGYEVHYFLISLSPIVKTVNINKDLRFKEYTDLFEECIKQGMNLDGFNVFFQNNEINIGRKIIVIDKKDNIISDM